MARIDFYVLSQSGEKARQIFACRLAEKAYRLNNSVHIQVPNKIGAQHIDELLWTFRDGSFLPHHVVGTSTQLDSPITIACDDVSIEDPHLLINLCDDIPVIADAFPRIAELVSSDSDNKKRSRQRFATYRDQGHQIDTHNI